MNELFEFWQKQILWGDGWKPCILFNSVRLRVRKEKNVSTTQILFPSPEKVMPQRKGWFCGGGVGCLSGLRPVLRHIDLAGKDLACPSVC